MIPRCLKRTNLAPPPLFHHRRLVMAPLTIASRTLARSAARCASRTVPACAMSTTAVARSDASASYSSPFKGNESKGNKIPNFGHYISKTAGNTNQLISYFMVGTMGALSAAGAKSTIHGE